MKNKTIVIFIVMFILLGISTYFYQKIFWREPPEILNDFTRSITFPSGGENFAQGDTYILKWDKDDSSSTTQIFLIDTSLSGLGESVSVSDRVYGVPDVGFYQYTIPEDLPDGVYKLSIGDLMSDDFIISSSSPNQT